MKLLVIDGNSILNRAFYGIRLLSAKDGTFTNAIFGFMNILQKLKTELSPDGVAVAFDRKAPTFRHKMYDGYKATRKGMPPELAQQLPLLKELLSDLGYPLVELDGYEADDILGTLAKASQEQGWQCVLATGDRDSFQLIGEGVTVRLASTQNGQPSAEIIDREKIIEKYGVAPSQLIDVKALMGDSSDNIPGVPGIGEKTALSLIVQFGSLEGVYQNLENPDMKASVRRKLEEGKELAQLSYRLARICTDAPIERHLSQYLPAPPKEAEAYQLLSRLEMAKLIQTLGLSNADVPETVAEKEKKEYVLTACDSQTFSQRAGLSNCQLYLLWGETVLLGVLNPQECRLWWHVTQPSFLPDLLRLLPKEMKVATNDAKRLTRMVLSYDLFMPQITFDLSLAAYLLNPTASDYSLERLVGEYRVPDAAIAEGASSEGEQLLRFAALCERLKEEVEGNGQHFLLYEVELPLARVLAEMEELGIAVDAEGIAEFGRMLSSQIEKLTAAIYDLSGGSFNLNSPKQLGEVLFERLGLPAKKKTKTGYSTNVDVLESLRSKHPVIGMILEYRKLAKLNSTYVEGLTKEIESDGRIHSVFNQTETRTGRISSAEPNLQNIPVRTELGREMRKFFAAKPGCVLLDADYSQIELRVLAGIAKDENMIAAFREGADIHARTASQVFDIPLDYVTPEMRSRAKAVNFGIVYGIGAFSLSQDIGVSVAEADQYIKSYLRNFSGVRQYMENTVKQAKEQGYVTTLFGRKRFLPELSSSNANLRAFGERAAMNTPIQGTAADIIKIAMVRVHKRLKEEGLQAKLILQVHDELIVECPFEEQEKASAVLKEEMEQAVSLPVPMLAEVHSGKNWYIAKS